MCGRRKQKQKLKTFKYARRNINPYSKVHRSFEQKDYELNHIKIHVAYEMLHIFIKYVHFQLMDI